MEELKPCPFCGAYPTLYCDLTDWRGKPVYAPSPTGYRPINYWLKAHHKRGCFIRQMNGMNEDGEMCASNWECLVETWNNREVKHGNNHHN